MRGFDDFLWKKKAEGVKRVLLCWNRGLGDLPLGLYALNRRILRFLPEVKIHYHCRRDLVDGFSLLPDIEQVYPVDVRRGERISLKKQESFACILENPDPTRWVSWQIGTLTPRLLWKREWDLLAKNFSLEGKGYLAIQPETHTHYGYEKNWQVAKWQQLIDHVKGQKVLLLGGASSIPFHGEHVIDLRGKTGLLQLLSVIKNHVEHLIVPDSGILSCTYYLDCAFALRLTSLWADPRQGILKQNVASPNPLLIHRPLLGRGEVVDNISVDEVLC